MNRLARRECRMMRINSFRFGITVTFLQYFFDYFFIQNKFKQLWNNWWVWRCCWCCLIYEFPLWQWWKTVEHRKWSKSEEKHIKLVQILIAMVLPPQDLFRMIFRTSLPVPTRSEILLTDVLQNFLPVLAKIADPLLQRVSNNRPKLAYDPREDRGT